jgi:hypothetical protein
MAEIYGLFSGRDGKVRYVGMTAGDSEARFREHQRAQVGRVITPVYEWIHREWRDAYPVECVCLESCNYAERQTVETKWINAFPNLLNERKVYWRPNKRPPIMPAIKEYMRGFIFNSGGFRGVHWWRDYDMYSVFIGGDWLAGGDSVPGGGGNIYFSTRTDALKARDKYRRCTSSWPRDIPQAAELLDCGTLLPDKSSFDFDSTLHAAECNTGSKSEFTGVIA